MPIAPQHTRTYLVTTVTANRRTLFQVEQNATLFLTVLNELKTQNQLTLHAFVIMPDHVHLLLTPAPAISLEKLMQLLKGRFSFRLKSNLPIWQLSFHSRRILNLIDLQTARNYIEENPVRANLVAAASSYPFSSACNEMR